MITWEKKSHVVRLNFDAQIHGFIKETETTILSFELLGLISLRTLTTVHFHSHLDLLAFD